MRNNVFVITNGENFCGNGFIIKPGFAITNSHVLRDGGTHAVLNKINIKFNVIRDFRPDNINKEAEIEDFALLQAEEFTLNDGVEFRTEDVPRLEELFILTYTNGNPSIAVKSGICNFPHGKFKNTSSVYLDKENYVVPGNSGSPVIDKQNKIVGIFYGFNETLSNAFFIKSSHILPLVEEFTDSLGK
jgi:S1-C subfamily serine protease